MTYFPYKMQPEWHPIKTFCKYLEITSNDGIYKTAMKLYRRAKNKEMEASLAYQTIFVKSFQQTDTKG